MAFDEATQRELQQVLEKETAKAQLQNTVHEFTGRCWDVCIREAKSNQLSSKESQCMRNCVERFIDASMFVVKRLQSLQN
ncbi:Mitochondrial import inner membrane translocase subunit tim8 [Coemansia javaensis]|uniref:Mitochondrial import inner membrane translocase subunit n=1 Tax=Coemansia javaensis TaxID=2761396 RepID=A0A9W8H6S9_9FUNG|nr:Mitochondrial import inner membrane translocase subunit tim8 [Coemansia javaensis]